MKHPLVPLLAFLLLLQTILTSATAQAQNPPLTFNVNTIADLIDDNTDDGICHTSANTCSLRAAVMQANHATAAAIVINVPAGTYLLNNPAGPNVLTLDVPPVDGQTLMINGVGATRTIVDANHADRVFAIAPSRIAILANLTMRNGNSGDSGGAILVDRATLTVRDAVIESSHAYNAGGAIATSQSALTILRSTIRANTVLSNGGGVFVGGTAAIRNSTFYGNGADSGGAICNYGQLFVVNSTISQNYSNTHGGGIYNGNKLYLYSSTITYNDADHDRDEGGGSGGGIFAQANTTTTITNSLVVDNTIGNAPVYNDCYGTMTAYGLSLFTDVSGCTLDHAWNIVPTGTVGNFQNNGGPTLTQAPHADSGAIDNTNDALGCVDETGATLTIDQRGAPRIAGLRCDVGAFEVGAVVDRIFKNGFD